MPRADVWVQQKPRKEHRRGFDLLRRQTDFRDDRKRDLCSEGSSYDREWGQAALRRKNGRKSLKVASQREAKEEICPGRTKWIRGLVCFEGSLLQVVFWVQPTSSDSGPFSGVHFNMCRQIHIRVSPRQSHFTILHHIEV